MIIFVDVEPEADGGTGTPAARPPVAKSRHGASSTKGRAVPKRADPIGAAKPGRAGSRKA